MNPKGLACILCNLVQGLAKAAYSCASLEVGNASCLDQRLWMMTVSLASPNRAECSQGSIQSLTGASSLLEPLLKHPSTLNRCAKNAEEGVEVEELLVEFPCNPMANLEFLKFLVVALLALALLVSFGFLSIECHNAVA